MSAGVQAGAMPMLHLYRHILKAARHFPSRKRDKIIVEIKNEFRANKETSDPKALEHARQVAERGLSDLQAYLPSPDAGDGISITLKGAAS